MPQISAPLSINDGLATPVARSFAPEQVSPQLAIFSERTAPATSGWKRLLVSLGLANAKRPTHKVNVTLKLPTLQTVNGVSTVAYTSLFNGTFTIPESATAAERADLHAFVVNSLNTTLLRGYVRDLDPAY